MIEAEEQIEQQKAIDKVTNAQQTLMSVLHHRDVPIDITDECEGVDKCYKNSYVEDLEAEVRTAFLAWKTNMDSRQKWALHLAKRPTVAVLVNADGVTVPQVIELQPIHNIQTLDIDFTIDQSIPHQLGMRIREQLNKPVYDNVDIAFKILG